MPKISRLPIIAGLITVIFVGLIYLFAWSSVFTAKSVLIAGAPTPAAEQLVQKTSQVFIGQRIARIEPRSVAQRLRQLTWIEGVDISRNWINGRVTIEIEPRVPSAYFEGKTIDSTGTIFELPGFSGEDLPNVSASSPELGVQAIAFFRTLPKSFSSQILSLTAHNESNFTLRVESQARELQVKWGANENSGLKIQVFNALLKLPENKNIRRIDLSAPHAPIVK